MTVWDVVVVGAGACGLTVARAVTEAGGSVLVIDKGSRPGGRLASRRIGEHVVDTAASSVRIVDPQVAACLERWAGATFTNGTNTDGADGGGTVWHFDVPANEVAARWAAGVERRNGFVTQVTLNDDGGASVVLNGAGGRHQARRVVMTAPAPQSAGIFTQSGLVPPDVLSGIHYDHALLVVAHLANAGDRPTTVDSPLISGLRWGSVTDPAAPVVVARAHNHVAADTLGEDANLTHGRLLVEMARLLADVEIQTAELKRWRYAQPVSQGIEAGFCSVPGAEVVAIAGDGFGGPVGADGVERAVHSGLAVAGWISN